MEKVITPKVRSIASGNHLIAKQMQANAGDLLPKHLSDMESILFIHEGECILNINDENVVLKQGEGYIIPPETKHQIKVMIDFKGLHFMPKSIKFQYF